MGRTRSAGAHEELIVGSAVSMNPSTTIAEVPPKPGRSAPLVLAGLLAGLLLGFMDVTIVSTAAPTIIADLGGLNLFAWVFSAFLIVQTVTIPIFGKLSDLYGRKRFFLLGLLIFMAGSALSGASQDIYQLIAFRAVQGIGFGAFVPATIAIAGDMFPPERRGQVQGLLFSINGVAFAIAPALGSFLTEAISWRWIFYINLPVGVVSLGLIYFALRESKAANASPFSDWLGASLLVGFFGIIAFLPLFAAKGLGASLGDQRNVIYAFTLPLTGGLLLGGTLISRFGFKAPAIVGAAISSVGILLITSIRSSSSILQLMTVCLPIGFGNGMMIPATIVAFQNSVERREIGIASGLATFTLNLGGAIGVSLLGAVQISLFASDLSVLLAGAPSGGAAVLQEAFAQSISSVFWIVLGVSVATFFAVLLMKRLAAGGAPATLG